MADDGEGADRDNEAREAAPLADLADRVRSGSGAQRTAPQSAADEEDPFGLGAFFSAESYGELASDELWESIDAEESLEPGVEAGAAPDEHIVPKRSYCETCEHFSPPPSVQCEHAGTTIVEFPDLDHVRVRSCPVVAERRAVGDDDRGRMTPSTFNDQ